mgnify:CR=1 FL=1
MPNDSLEELRLTLMQDFLPVGMAIVDRVKKEGLSELVQFFNNSDDPVNQLRREGDLKAQSVRQKLDDISPGLGNPVMNVKVSVEENEYEVFSLLNESELLIILERVEDRIDSLLKYLDESN